MRNALSHSEGNAFQNSLMYRGGLKIDILLVLEPVKQIHYLSLNQADIDKSHRQKVCCLKYEYG